MLSFIVGVVGVIVGAVLARRNARKGHADGLLCDALDDLISAIAEVAAGDETAQPRYASAVSRVALHGSPTVVAAFRAFQVDANTGTEDGRRRLVAALNAARAELGRKAVPSEAAATLLFGPTPVDRTRHSESSGST